MATITLTQLANLAALDLQVVDSGEALSTQQVTDALSYVNYMLDNWSIDRLMAPFASITNVAATGTVATGVPAPYAIESASIITSVGQVKPLKILTAVEWEALDNREKQSAWTRYLFYDRNGAIHLSPVPTAGTLEYTWWAPLPQFVDATTPLVFTSVYSGYFRMLVKGAAMEMATQMSVKPSESLVASFQQAMNNVRKGNEQLFGATPPVGAVAAQ